MFKPLHSLVTVVLDPKKDRTDGGLVIPDVCEAAFRTGVVRAVGPGQTMDCLNAATQTACYTGLPIQPGDRVVIGVQKNQAGRPVNLGGMIDDDGVEVVLVNIQDIWGTIDKAPALPVSVN